MRAVVILVFLVTAACGGGDTNLTPTPDAPPPTMAPPDPPPCEPQSCTARGYTCGEVSDGCGRTLACGMCGPGLSCTAANVCEAVVVDVDVKTVAVCGTVTANGAIPTQTCASPTDPRGEVFFYDEVGYASFRFPLPCGAAGQPAAFAGRVYPGRYRIAVLGAPGSNLPAQTVTVATGVAVAADLAGLSYDVTTRAVGGTVTLNGQIPAQTCVAGSGVERAQVHFKELSGGFFSFRIPCADPATPYTFAGSVPPGIYDVAVSGSNSALPQTSRAVERGLVIDRDRTALAYDLLTHRVSGTVTLDGASPTQNATCRAGITRGAVGFASTTSSERIGLRIACDAANPGSPFSFSGEVYPGTYAIEVTGGDSNLPRMTYRLPGTITIDGPREGLAVDVRTATVAGTVTLDGAPPPACTGATWGKLTFESQQPYYNESVVVPCPAAAPPGTPFAFEILLFPGDYTVFAQINGAAGLFVGGDRLHVDAPLTGVRLDGTTRQHAVSGTVTMNGVIPESECVAPAERAVVELADLDSGVTVDLPVPCAAPGSPFTFAGTAPPGTYRVGVRGVSSSLPAHLAFAAQPLVLAGPTSGLTYDVSTRHVAGTLTLEGAAPTCGGRTPAKVSFIDETSHLTFGIDARCDAVTGAVRYDGHVFPGVYTVVVYGAQSSLPAAGFLAATRVVIR